MARARRSDGGVWTARRVTALTGALVGGAALLRSWAVLGGEIDAGALVAVGASNTGAEVPSSLLNNVVGRFAAEVAPLEFWPLAVSLLALWLLYCGSSLLAARALAPLPQVQLILLTGLLFIPVTLPGMASWPQGGTQITLACGFLLTTAGVTRVVTTGRFVHAWPIFLGTVIAIIGSPSGPWSVSFLLIPWCGALLVWPQVVAPQASPGGVNAAWRSRVLVMGGLVCLYAAWAALFGARPFGDLPRDLGPVAGYLGGSVGAGIIPGLMGGPLSWTSGPSAWPSADPPTWSIVVGLQVLLAGVASALFITRRGLIVFGIPFAASALVVCYFVLGNIPAAAGTGSQMLGLAAIPAVLVVTLASVLHPTHAILGSLPKEWRRFLTPVFRRWAAVILMDVFVALSVVSIVAWGYARPAFPGQPYTDQVRTSLADAPADVPLLPQVIPFSVIDPAYTPLNTTDVVFGPLDARPPFRNWTTELRNLDEEGNLAAATVEGVQVPVFCGSWAPEFFFSPELPEFVYVAEIGLAEPARDGFSVRLGDGQAVNVPPAGDATRFFVQLKGSGSSIAIVPQGSTPICVQSVIVGQPIIRLESS